MRFFVDLVYDEMDTKERKKLAKTFAMPSVKPGQVFI